MGAIWLLLALATYIGVIYRAEKLNRSKLVWFVISLFVTPPISWLILEFLGKYSPPPKEPSWTDNYSSVSARTYSSPNTTYTSPSQSTAYSSEESESDETFSDETDIGMSYIDEDNYDVQLNYNYQQCPKCTNRNKKYYLLQCERCKKILGCVFPTSSENKGCAGYPPPISRGKCRECGYANAGDRHWYNQIYWDDETSSFSTLFYL